MKVTIYGKTRCTFCTSAKQLCEQKGIEYEYLLLDADYKAEELFEKVPNARTFPQIFINGNPIGGFQEFQQVLDLNERRNN